ncbi:MAG: dethiobiotin synthase [Planctomycetaceae bacterium]
MKPPGLLITGTDTNVGKTYLTCQLARALKSQSFRVGIYKPVCTGSEDSGGSKFWPDIQALSEALGGEFTDDLICPQKFDAPMAPPSAARLENRLVDDALLRTGLSRWNEQVDVLLIEGVGGFLCPVSTESTVADLAEDFQVPVLIVARTDLGTINHTLMSVQLALSRKLDVVGVIMNSVNPAANEEIARTSAEEIACRTKVPVLGILPHNFSRVHNKSVPTIVEPPKSCLHWRECIRKLLLGEKNGD